MNKSLAAYEQAYFVQVIVLEEVLDFFFITHLPYLWLEMLSFISDLFVMLQVENDQCNYSCRLKAHFVENPRDLGTYSLNTSILI